MQRFSDLFEHFPVKLLAVACFSAVPSMADRVLRHRESHFLHNMDALYPVLYPMRRYHSPPPFLSSSPMLSPSTPLPEHPNHLRHLSNLSHLTRSVGEFTDDIEKGGYFEKKETLTEKLERLETHKDMQTGIDIMMDQLLSIRRIRDGPD